MSRSVLDLHPQFQPLAVKFLKACDDAGLGVLLVCTLRTMEEQAKLYAQGRTTPGKIVTNAPPGSSAHNYGLALDGCPTLHGKLIWNLPEGDSVNDPLWQQYGEIAEAHGLEWAGRWKGKMVEGPHVQPPQWKQIAGVP